MELGVVTADGHGVIRTVNQHACKMFGYAKEDLINKKINVLMPSPYAEQHDAYLQRYERTKKARLLGTCRVVDGRRSNGEVFSLRLSLSKIESEEEGIIWVSLFEPIKQNQLVLTLDPDGEKILDCTGHPELLGHTSSTLKGASIRSLIPKGLRHSPCSSVKNLSDNSPKEQFPFGRSRNFLALHKNGKDSIWVSVVIKERTLLTAKGSGSPETPPEHPSSHPNTGGASRCPFHAENYTVHYPGEVKETCVGGDRSLLMAVLTPIEKDVEGMATIDERGIVRSCNSSFLTLFGYSQEEMIGRSIGSLMSEMALPVLRAIAGEKNLTDAQRRIIGKGFHAALGLHRDLTVFPMKFCVDELFPSPPLPHHAPDAAGDGDAMEIEHSISSAPVLYQCTIQRLRADEEQDLKELLAETYEDLLETGAAHPHRVSTNDLPGAIKKEALEHKAAQKEKKKKDVPIGDSPTTRRFQQGAYAGAYTYDVTLGGGYFGKVKMAIHRLTGEKVAIKTLRKRQYENIKMTYPPRELKLMMSLNHPNIYKLLEVVEMEDRLLMITEFCSGGEVFDYMAKQDHFDDKESRRLFRQLVSAVDYMHLNGICHRDLKLENLLLDENKNIKIIDLGLGNFFDRQHLLDSFCGTADYASPELWQGKRYVGPEVDIWSMGVLLFVFLTGKMPFLSPRHAVAGDFFFPSYPLVSESAKALIRRMLVANSSHRADMEEVRNHPWVKAEDGTPPPRYFAKRLADLDRDIIKQMVELLGFEEQSIISSLSHNDFNQFTTTYQLLLNKKSRLQAAAQRPKDVQAHKKAQQQQPQQQQPAQQAHHEGLCTIS